MYIMKTNSTVIFVVLAILLVLFLSTFMGAASVVPFQFDKSTLHEFPYEGFRSQIDYTTYPQNKPIDFMTSKSIVDEPVVDKVKVRGFDGLLPSPNLSDASIDTYSQAPASNTAKSYGYSNSMGFLSLNDDQIRLLTTRGGNMSSGEAFIGQN
jgi:hypothetical protein